MAKAKRAKPRMVEILESMPSWEVRRAAEWLIEVAEEHDAFPEPGSNGFSIRFPSGPGWQLPISVAWIYPNESGWSSAKFFSFGKRTQGEGPESLPEYVENVLRDWTRALGKLPYTNHVTAKNGEFWVVSHADAVKHIEELAGCLKYVLLELKTIHAEDMEDFRMAEEVMERVRKGEMRTYSSAEVRANLGLDS